MNKDSATVIRSGLELARWTTRDLWVAAVGIGGSLSHHDIEEIASGQRSATATEHDILATAFNEHFTDLGEDRPIRYWQQLPAAPS